MLIATPQTKKPPLGRLSARFFVSSLLRRSPRQSGAKVKKETKNGSMHACLTLLKLFGPIEMRMG
jgi:hypothetical protein